MQKFKKVILLTLLLTPLLVACGSSDTSNKEILNDVYKFNYAQVKLVDGSVVDGELDTWSQRSENDTIRVTFKDGKSYLTHTSNVILYNK